MNELEISLIRQLIELSLREDLEPAGDLSSLLTVDEKQIAKANIVAKEAGVMSCSFVISEILELGEKYLIERFLPSLNFRHAAELDCQPLKLEFFFSDTESFSKGDTLLTITGSATVILALERTVLNFMQRLMGISTLTAKLTQKLVNKKTKLLDTRKTSPGMRVLEKMAFKHGSALNHRLNLSDMIMLKENHISLSKFRDSLEALQHCAAEIKRNKLTDLRGEALRIEIEINADNLDLLEPVIKQNLADVIMLDNFSVAELKDLMQRISDLQGNNQKKVLIEFSGGINPENIDAYLDLEPDYISTSYVSKNVHSIDLSMLIYKMGV